MPRYTFADDASEHAGPDAMASRPGSDNSTNASHSSVIVKDGVHLALTSPFVFLGLTIFSLLLILFLLMYCAYRLLRRHRLKTGGVEPTLRRLPIRIVARPKQRNENEETIAVEEETLGSTETIVSSVPTFVYDGPVRESGTGKNAATNSEMDITDFPCESTANGWRGSLSLSDVWENGLPMQTVRLVTPDKGKSDTETNKGEGASFILSSRFLAFINFGETSEKSPPNPEPKPDIKNSPAFRRSPATFHLKQAMAI